MTTWSKFDAAKLLLNERLDLIISGDLFINEFNESIQGSVLVGVAEPEKVQMYPFIHRRFEPKLKNIEAAIKNALEQYKPPLLLDN